MSGNETPCVADPQTVLDEDGSPLEGAVLRRQFLAMRAELHLMKTAGIVEVASRNPSVGEYMTHWESRAINAENALADAGVLRDAAGRVSEWFCTEARHLEGPRIQGLRMAMLAYDRHMQPNPMLAARDDNTGQP